jgi:hypothetical protein
LTERKYFVRDYGNKNVYTALIVSLPKNHVLLNCINQIVSNVKNKKYGADCLNSTIPTLLTTNFTKNQIDSIEMYEMYHDLVKSINKYYIVKNNTIILSWYD